VKVRHPLWWTRNVWHNAVGQALGNAGRKSRHNMGLQNTSIWYRTCIGLYAATGPIRTEQAKMSNHKNRLTHLSEPRASESRSGSELRFRVIQATGIDDSPDGATALLRLLTRLANCGLDAAARPVLPSMQSRS
jgi:hypothetical protein